MMIEYKSRIDTLETIEPNTNRENADIVDIKGTDSYYNKNMDLITKYNPNNFDYQYSKDYKLSKTIATYKEMQNVLTVIDTNAVNMRRIDIATDLTVPFNDISKLLDLTHKCIRFKEKDGKAWCNTSESDLQVSNYLYHNRFKLEIEFYDKYRESNGTSNYPTRLEIRFLRISSKDFSLHVNNAIKLWQAMPNNLEEVEQTMVELLKDKWLKEKQLSPKLTLTVFAYKWSDKIFTLNILKELYKFAGLNGSFNSWLQSYRKNYPITFYTKNDLKNFSKDIITSLKNYMKS